MGRVINPESGSRNRTKLSQSIVLALRELMKQTKPDENSRDQVAYISKSLLQIYNIVDASVAAWEKKDYWLKADRYRREWEWTKTMGEGLETALLNDDWASIAMGSAKVAQKFNKVNVAARNRIGTPWVGAYKCLKVAK